jgi:hypothetical protein
MFIVVMWKEIGPETSDDCKYRRKKGKDLELNSISLQEV